MTTTAVTRIPNQGAMSDFVRPFEVASKMTDMVYRCRFSHCWNGIATRHADTIDCKFYVDAKGVILGLAHTAFIEFSDRAKRNLTDREASFIAAEYLRERLEQEDEHELYDVPPNEVIRIINKLGIR
ncbi:MAG TPA: hypothetical protein VMV59_03920 [Candidatus Dormibacteraeota bacterium]|nr:hypothetical protein [Candidatus Dormibacteraeota bacterium]